MQLLLIDVELPQIWEWDAIYDMYKLDVFSQALELQVVYECVECRNPARLILLYGNKVFTGNGGPWVFIHRLPLSVWVKNFINED